MIKYLSVVAGFLALLVACQSEPKTVEPTETIPVPTAIISTPTSVSETVATQPTEPEVVVDECIGCHTDKQKLVDHAKPEEEIISENEGAG